jgi:hypothetical protein
VPFDFLKRRKDGPAAEPAPSAAPAVAPGRGIAFDAVTEEWRLTGRMDVDGRLSDVLNKRESVPIDDVRWAPVDGSGPMTEAPGLRAIDPYDLILVLAGETTLPPMTEDEKTAHRIHKVRYDLALEAPPYRVVGTVYLYPGTDPSRLLDRSGDMFIPVTDARATLGNDVIDGGEATVILLNRFYLRGVDQVDSMTGERAQPLPGLTPGGPGGA